MSSIRGRLLCRACRCCKMAVSPSPSLELKVSSPPQMILHDCVERKQISALNNSLAGVLRNLSHSQRKIQAPVVGFFTEQQWAFRGTKQRHTRFMGKFQAPVVGSSLSNNGHSGERNIATLMKSTLKQMGDDSSALVVEEKPKSSVGGGVEDVYDEDRASEDYHVTPWTISISSDYFNHGARYYCYGMH